MEKQWFYAREDKTEGPVSEEELLQMFLSDEIDNATLIWMEGMNDWEPFDNIFQYTEEDIPPSQLLIDEWWVIINGKTEGTFRIPYIKKLIRLGEVTGETLVWKHGLKEWKLISETEEFK